MGIGWSCDGCTCRSRDLAALLMFLSSFIVRVFAGVSVELPSVNKLPLCTGGAVCGEVGD